MLQLRPPLLLSGGSMASTKCKRQAQETRLTTYWHAQNTCCLIVRLYRMPLTMHPVCSLGAHTMRPPEPQYALSSLSTTLH